MTDQVPVAWRKSRRSGTGDNCVELAALPGLVLIRDSKNPEGCRLSLCTKQFGDLLARMKRAELDTP